MNHMSAGADQEHSPSKEQVMNEDQSSPRRRIVSGPKKASPSHSDKAGSDEVLIVVSKLKAFVKESSDLNTSADVMPVLSEIVRRECLAASERARLAGRKTLMARDFD